jgi:hypothetical protein
LYLQCTMNSVSKKQFIVQGQNTVFKCVHTIHITEKISPFQWLILHRVRPTNSTHLTRLKTLSYLVRIACTKKICVRHCVLSITKQTVPSHVCTVKNTHLESPPDTVKRLPLKLFPDTKKTLLLGFYLDIVKKTLSKALPPETVKSTAIRLAP